MSLSYLAILVATIVFFGIGAVWYTVFSKQWLNAIERTTEDMKKMSHMPTPWFPFVLSFVVNGAYFLIGMVVSGAILTAWR